MLKIAMNLQQNVWPCQIVNTWKHICKFYLNKIAWQLYHENDFISIQKICISMKDTQMPPPGHAANLVANSGNTTYGVERFVCGFRRCVNHGIPWPWTSFPKRKLKKTHHTRKPRLTECLKVSIEKKNKLYIQWRPFITRFIIANIL